MKRWREPSLEAMLRKREEPPSPGHHFLEFDFSAFFLDTDVTPLVGALSVETILRPN